MVLGHPTTHILEFLERKYSAKRAAFVLESSPPMTTRPSSLSDSQYFKDFSKSYSFSILSLPEQIISKPPLFLK